jgi:hypothetical protein
MRRFFLSAAIAVLAAPVVATQVMGEEFSLKKPLVSTPSVVIPFSAKDSFGQPSAPGPEAFPGENREQNVEFQIRGDDKSGGSFPGVTVTATRSAYPSPSPLFRR